MLAIAPAQRVGGRGDDQRQIATTTKTALTKFVLKKALSVHFVAAVGTIPIRFPAGVFCCGQTMTTGPDYQKTASGSEFATIRGNLGHRTAAALRATITANGCMRSSWV